MVGSGPPVAMARPQTIDSWCAWGWLDHHSLNPIEGIEQYLRDVTLSQMEGSRGGRKGHVRLGLPPLPLLNRKDVIVVAQKSQKTESLWRTAEPQPPQIHLTDTGNALRLVAEHGAKLQYCWPWKKWLYWTGKIWRIDAEAEVHQRAGLTVRQIHKEAAAIKDKQDRNALMKWGMDSEDVRRRNAMVSLARSEPEIACTHTIFDTDPWLMNTRNGTLDLRTGKLQPHSRGDFITRMIPVLFDPDAQCPKWEHFIDGVFDGNSGVTDYVQQAAGYSLTGDVSEDAIFFLHGDGANGKTTLFLTLQNLLGPYALQVSPGLLLKARYETHSTAVADLFGVRLAMSVEVGQGRKFDEERLKQLSGGDKIRARRMRENFWEFDPTHKIWLAANEKPVVTGQDHATWRRIKLIPFNVKFTNPGQPGPDKDPALRKSLFRDERPGILNWLLAGCLAWQADGLIEPPEVKGATQEYKQEEDVVQQFIDAECMVGDGLKETSNTLFKAYQRWRRDTNATEISQNAFGRRLTDLGFKSIKQCQRRLRQGIQAHNETDA